jgi:predicted RNase H-like nuclease (RuvC/YqgF family)
VAEAARKAQEQKKTAPKPKKVYTDDDIPTRGGLATPGGQTAAPSKETPSDTAKGQAGTGGAEAQGAGADKDKNGEAAWRKRFAELRGKISQAETELDILQREGDKSQLQYYTDPQKALQEQNTRKDINEKNAKIEAKKKEIANLKQQFDDLEVAMKRAGGDSGWSRE